MTDAETSPGDRPASGWGGPIVSRHVADDVVDRLVTAVALGLWVPNQQLPTERALATMLHVLRSSVRAGATVAISCWRTGGRVRADF